MFKKMIEVPFKSCFMHYPQTPNFNLANLEEPPLLFDYWIVSKSRIKPNAHRI